MEMQKLSQEMKKIEMPEEMKKRIIENCNASEINPDSAFL